LLAATRNLKDQTALSVTYGAGPRASEVAALKVGDVDSTRMTLRIRQGKGGKDCYAMLSPVMLERTQLCNPARRLPSSLAAYTMLIADGQTSDNH
jgi:integrase/recombinase XerD